MASTTRADIAGQGVPLPQDSTEQITVPAHFHRAEVGRMAVFAGHLASARLRPMDDADENGYGEVHV